MHILPHDPPAIASPADARPLRIEPAPAGPAQAPDDEDDLIYHEESHYLDPDPAETWHPAEIARIYGNNPPPRRPF